MHITSYNSFEKKPLFVQNCLWTVYKYIYLYLSTVVEINILKHTFKTSFEKVILTFLRMFYRSLAQASEISVHMV